MTNYKMGYPTMRLTFAICLCLSLFPGLAWAQTQSDQPTMAELLRRAWSMETGPVVRGGTRRVLMRDFSGKKVVAKVHVEVGGRFLTLLPEGRLASIEKQNCYLTQSPFVPATRESMIKELKKEFFGFEIAESKHYIFVYNSSKAFQEQAASILETIHDGVVDHFKSVAFTVHEPHFPLVAVIFRTEQEFLADAGEFGKVGYTGFYWTTSNRITMFEESGRLRVYGDQLAGDTVLQTVAHEGVHQTLMNIGVQPRMAAWPDWVTEGLAEFFAPTTEGTPIRWKGAGQVNDGRMASLEQYFKKATRADGKIVRDLCVLENLDSEQYASAWALTHYLHKTMPATYLEYIRELSLRHPMDIPATSDGKGKQSEAEMESFNRYFGRDLSAIEAGMIKHLRSLKFENPWSNVPHYLVMLEYRNGDSIHRRTGLGVRPEHAAEFKTESWEKLSPSERTNARYYNKTFPNRSQAHRYAYLWLRS